MLNANNPNTYKVGNNYFRSKLQAVLYSNQVKQPIEWLFAYDEVFKNYPWHIEPEETLDELYNQRARQLRAKYNYLIISYSGGSDSHNMLMSFVRQGIFIDEILVAHNSWFSEKSINDSADASNIDAEYLKNVVPKLKALADKIPNTKITTIDTSKNYLHFVDNINDNWIKQRNCWINPFAERFNFFTSDEFRKNIESRKNIGLVLGIDKPKTFIDDKKFYVEFSDITFTGSSAEQFNAEYDNFETDFFYWSDETARMVCKQCHIIKKYVEMNPHHIADLDVKQKYNPSYFRKVIERFLPRLIYSSTWDNGFQVTKSNGGVYNEFDTHWWNVLSDSQKTKWNEFIDYVKVGGGNDVFYLNGKIQNLKVFTKKYKFGDLK